MENMKLSGWPQTFQQQCKWLGEQNIEIGQETPQILIPQEPLVNTQKVGGQKKTSKIVILQALIMKEWVVISQDLAEKLISSIPGRIAEVLEKKGQHCKCWLFA